MASAREKGPQKPLANSPSASTDLRERYENAVGANAAAHASLQELKTAIRDQPASSQSADAEIGSHANAYLNLLRQRKNHATSQIVHRHVERLSQMPAARSHFLKVEPFTIDLSYDTNTANHLAAGETRTDENQIIEALTETLERAVLRAKHQLSRERNLLDQIREQNRSSSVSTHIPKAQKLRGMSAVQTELFSWIEARLTESQEAELANAELEHDPEPDHTTEDTLSGAQDESIETHYKRYLEARKQLLSAGALISKAINHTKALELPQEASPTGMHTFGAPPSILPMVERQLLPSRQFNQEAKLQLSVLNRLLSDGQRQTLQALDRLADESHLLTSYPILSQGHTFSNISPSARPGPLQLSGIQSATDKTHEQIEAWTFASREAAIATETYVLEHLGRGEELLDEADGHIRELQRLVGDADNEEEADEDTWADDINAQQREARQVRKSADPWSLPNGKIGLGQPGPR